MKKWLLGVMAAVMAVSLAACTPTPDKQKEETAGTAAAQESMVPQSTGGASDKVPDPDVAPVAIVSIYHKGDGDSLVQDMDSLDSEEIDAQMLVSKMMEYNVFTDGTMVQTFAIEGEGEGSVGTLDLNQAVSGEGVSDNMFLTEIGNTFIENFELGQLKLTVNGENYQGETVQQGDDDYLTYVVDYDMVE